MFPFCIINIVNYFKPDPFRTIYNLALSSIFIFKVNVIKWKHFRAKIKSVVKAFAKLDYVEPMQFAVRLIKQRGELVPLH